MIFGGYTENSPYFSNELYILDLKLFSNSISFQTVKNVNISNRCKHVCFLYKRKMYIYGGYGLNISNNIQILNDFYYLDLDSGKTVEVLAKGGMEMINFLFHITQINDHDIAFFHKDLSKFFVFDISNEIFTKVDITLNVPSNRSCFTVNKLSDNRIILIGGMNEDECYSDVFILNSYDLGKSQVWAWCPFDTNGKYELNQVELMMAIMGIVQ